MEFKGVEIKVDDGNELIIDPDCNFSLSRIFVQGENNSIIINKALMHQKLFINIKGDNKKIVLGESKKNIVDLKIVSIRGNNQTVSIGTDFSCGGCEIQMNDGNENLTIGDDCLFSWGIKLRTSDGHSVVDLKTLKAINLPKDVVIGDHVWVGEDVKFLKGSVIPNNSIVGSGSIVTKKFSEENVVIAGFPALIMKRGVTWDRRMPEEFNLSKEL